MKANIDLQPIFTREKIIKICRNHFDQKNFHEVISPVLNVAVPSEATLFPFSTEWKTHQGTQKLFLSISPESSLKKMMAAGIGNCYSISKSFRNLESAGNFHNPEFLMLEWYQFDASMEDIMNEVEKIFEVISQKFELQKDDKRDKLIWQVISLEEKFKEHIGVSIKDIQEFEKIVAVAKAKGYTTEDSTWEQLFDQLYLNEVEPKLPTSPYFLIDFPAQISPLCEPRTDKKFLSQRFEVFINGVELGNGNVELTDSNKVGQSFEKVHEARESLSESNSPIDKEFLEALDALQGRKISGIGIGIDRLAMFFSGQNRIESVEPFTLPSL